MECGLRYTGEGSVVVEHPKRGRFWKCFRRYSSRWCVDAPDQTSGSGFHTDWQLIDSDYDPNDAMTRAGAGVPHPPVSFGSNRMG